MSTRTVGTAVAGPLDLPVEEYLARLKKNRRRTLAALDSGRWRLTSAPVGLDVAMRLVDETVRDDGTVDLSALSPDTGTITPTYFGPAMVDAAVKVVALCMAAFTAGYAVGKEVGEALDDDAGDEGGEEGGGGEGGGDDEGGGDGGRASRSSIILEPLGQGKLSVRVGAIPTAARAVPLTQMTVQEFLARLKSDRDGAVRDLTRNRNWRIVSEPVGSAPMDLLDTAVRPDGSLDLSAFADPTPADVQMAGPLVWAIGAVAGAVVASFVVGAVVGFAVETLGDDSEGGEGEGEGEPGGGDDTSDTGGGGGDGGSGGSGSSSTGRKVVGLVQPGRDDDVVLSVLSAT